jgi:ketosteroid isomerase-like protein
MQPNSLASPTPVEVLRALLAGVESGAGAELADLYAEDAYVVHPMDPDGAPPMRGRPAIRNHFEQAGGLRLRVVDLTVHETADEEVVIGEFAYEVLDQAGESLPRLPCVFVMRVRNGLIVESRDYAPPPPQ